ncbi:hypothetical protein CALVIDRAFT_537726 [Calocera viscosa TUFC12733]|uniref:Histone chaperone domain-containing protein n=1 Tax=Calocera viscosa (strain TUFC12733) TaxID=1330018 RepID=A0A167LJ06_CALVF|nr:hypothetical protein CALVIDRAFT_537726 [Calocera viscosa TUFC12733]
MSTEVTTDTTHENGNAQPKVEAPVSQDKGKGKAVEPVDEEMDDDEDDEEEEEEEEEEVGFVEGDDPDPSLIISAPRRRAQVDYSSKEALEKAGLAPEPEAAADEEDEYMGNGEEDE